MDDGEHGPEELGQVASLKPNKHTSRDVHKTKSLKLTHVFDGAAGHDSIFARTAGVAVRAARAVGALHVVGATVLGELFDLDGCNLGDVLEDKVLTNYYCFSKC